MELLGHKIKIKQLRGTIPGGSNLSALFAVVAAEKLIVAKINSRHVDDHVFINNTIIILIFPLDSVLPVVP